LLREPFSYAVFFIVIFLDGLYTSFSFKKILSPIYYWREQISSLREVLFWTFFIVIVILKQLYLSINHLFDLLTLETKVQLQKLGKEIVQVLQDRLPRRVTADNQDLIVRSRGCDRADYIFAVNDKRTFGDYVGQWRLVPEKGEPNSGIVTVHHPAAAAYDLVKHQPVVLKKQDRKCSFQVDLAPGSGKLILLLDRAINSIDLNMPERIKQGEKYTIKLQISDKNRQVIAACLPVEVTLTAANSVKLPGSGYYAAVNGSLIINEIMAPNAPAGKAKISVRCLASGKIAEKSFIIE